MSRRLLAAIVAFALLFALLPPHVHAAGDRPVVLASTTSTENSGLFDHILPRFTADTGITVRVIAVGTGQAFRLARNGDADVVLVHDRAGEDALVADGFGLARYDVMANDFVILCPADDPAGIDRMETAAGAFARIAATATLFASRGDDSGTHRRELALWRAAGIDPRATGRVWYRELGAGMGATLNTAVALGACLLSDRATWATFGNRAGHAVVVEGDPALFNPYGVIAVDPARHPHVNGTGARAFVDWLTGPRGQAAIAAFRPGGVQLFQPTAGAEPE